MEGKSLKRLILARLTAHIDNMNELSPRQYGFRPDRGTTDVMGLSWPRQIRLSVDWFRTGTYAVLERHLMLDIRNTFNSILWKPIDAALKRKWTPHHLRRILRSYLSWKTLMVFQFNTLARQAMSCGIPWSLNLRQAL